MHVPRRALLAALLSALVLPALATDPGPRIKYEVRIERTWSQATHPLDYPADAHFSPGIGATHNAKYRMFAEGGTATAGLETLSQRGKTTPFDKEIAAAKGHGNVGTVFNFEPLKTEGATTTATFEATDGYPLVSLAAMVAPSPDWFTGLASFALKRDGKWIDSETVTLYAWDSGTNNATTYKAKKITAKPFQPIAINGAPMFVKDGKKVPVATLTIRRME